MADDITLGMGLDTSDFTQGVNVFEEAITFIRDQALQAADDFATLESQAASLGTSVEALAGITSDTAESYTFFAEASADLQRNFQGVRIEAMEPVISLWGDLKRGVDNALNSVQDFARNGSISEGDLLSNIVSGFSGRSRRPDTQELEARQAFQDKQDALEQAKEQEEFEERIAQLKERQATAAERQQQRSSVADAVGDLRGAQFGQLQAVDRAAFLRRQQLQLQNAPAGVPFEEFQRRQQTALAEFDLRQSKQETKQGIRQETAEKIAAVKTESNTKAAAEKLGELVDEFRTWRDNQTGLDIDIASIVEQI